VERVAAEVAGMVHAADQRGRGGLLPAARQTGEDVVVGKVDVDDVTAPGQGADPRDGGAEIGEGALLGQHGVAPLVPREPFLEAAAGAKGEAGVDAGPAEGLDRLKGGGGGAGPAVGGDEMEHLHRCMVVH
jgi:hypothetical protein